MSKPSKDLLNKRCVYDGSTWKIVGVTFNILGVFVTIRSTKSSAEKSVNFDEVKMEDEL